MKKTSSPQRASGAIFGLAIGDALGAPTEFMPLAAIVQRYGPQGPSRPSDRVTDDTQMTLAVGEALLELPPPCEPAALEASLRRAFVAWYRSPDNNRAPGNTCMQACMSLSHPERPWHEATMAYSKGCGANMRVVPVGLLPSSIAEPERAGIAQFQAALTHGHPTALAASDLTAAAVADLRAGGDAAGLPRRLREYAHRHRSAYHERWLGQLWQRNAAASPQDFIERGWDECLITLDRLEAAMKNPDRSADPCSFTGSGWTAEQALGTGLLCFLLFPDDPIATVRRAAVTSGDSDSIASLAGAFAGAYHGLSAWPPDWVEGIEYHDRLARLGSAWD